jgi:signal transduction histidine kinase
MPPESSEARSSVGMVGMRARARQCGGELTITPVEPQGVCVEVVVPALSNEEFTS